MATPAPKPSTPPPAPPNPLPDEEEKPETDLEVPDGNDDDDDEDLEPRPVEEMQPYLKAMIFGPWGCGKTTLVATAQQHAAMATVLIINFEGGLLSIVQSKGVLQVTVRNVDQVERVFWKVVNKEGAYAKVRTVVIDSGTELQAVNLQDIALAQWKKNKKKRESPDEIFQQDYGKDTARLKRVFRMFRDGPFNFIVTALSKKVFEPKPKNADKDFQPDLIEVCPAFTSKLGTSIAGFVDHVWYMYEGEPSEEDRKRDPNYKPRYLLTSEKGVYKAKTRGHRFYNKIGQVVKDPNLATLYETLLTAEGLKSNLPSQPTVAKK